MQPQGRVGDIGFSPADAHGCVACAHPVAGPATQGSTNVFVNGLGALRDKDPGIHAACCGSNSWNAKGGAPHVFINGEKAFRQNDATAHCGGDGTLITGSGNVFVGNKGGGSSSDKSWIHVRIRDTFGRPLRGLKFRLTLPDGGTLEGKVDRHGWVMAPDIPNGACSLELLREERSPKKS